MSTRLGNMKRHIERKHGGMGKPALRYIFRNSIIAPEETPSSRQIFYDESANEPSITRRFGTLFLDSDSRDTQNSYSSLDKWLDNCIEALLKPNEILAGTNAVNQPLNMNPPVNFSLVESPTFSLPKYTLKYPAQDRVNSSGQVVPDRDYQGVSGFKINVCDICLQMITVMIGHKNPIQDSHKCDSRIVDIIKTQDPTGYASHMRDLLSIMPQFLLHNCKEWAKNTSGQLYITARKIESSDMSEIQTLNVQINHDQLSFLNKLLAQSKIIPTDIELFEFLKLAIIQTKIVITLRGESDQINSKYLLAVTNV